MLCTRIIFSITSSFWKASVNPLNHLCRQHNQVSFLHKSCLLLNNNGNIKSDVEEESESDSETNSQEDEHFTDLKLQLLDAGLKFVPDHGWTKQSIALGAKSLGLSSASHTLIKDGGADLVHYFNFLCNANLNTHLKEQSPEFSSRQMIQKYLENAMEVRLKMITPYVQRWPEAMALMLSPNHISTDLQNLFELVDIIWGYSGNNDLMATWYTKRLLLAGSYKLCELSLVQDKSTDFSNSIEFLKRQVEIVVNSDKCLDQVISTSEQFPKYGAGAFHTIQNILGLNRWFR